MQGSGSKIRAWALSVAWLLLVAGGLSAQHVHQHDAGEAGTSAPAAEVATAPREGNTNDICPVTPEEWTEPEFSAEFRGKQVQFCCRKCRAQFLENPEKYLSRLPQFGGNPSAALSEESTAPAAVVASEKAPAAPEVPARPPTEPRRSRAELSSADRAVRFLGKFHPLLVHFPLAAIWLAFLAELLGWFWASPQLGLTGRHCAIAAGITAPIAVVAGLALARGMHSPAAVAEVLELHRWFGLAAAAGCIATASVAASSTYLFPARRRLYRILLSLTVLATSFTGHLGGTLVFGADYFNW